jgi:hypothetical protein
LAIKSDVPPEAGDEVTWPWPWPGSAAPSAQGAPGRKPHQKLPPQTYRTICVRLCDGGYFPISLATTRARFAHDEAMCRSRCGTPARLYVYRNPGGVPDYMHDLDGNAYSELAAAFLFRTAYDPACTCKPQPWTTASRELHRGYALQATAALPTKPEQATDVEDATAAAGAGEGAGPAEAETPAAAPESEPRARRGRSAPANSLRAAALEGRASSGSRRREAASRRFDGTDWRITPYQPF